MLSFPSFPSFLLPLSQGLSVSLKLTTFHPSPSGVLNLSLFSINFPSCDTQAINSQTYLSNRVRATVCKAIPFSNPWPSGDIWHYLEILSEAGLGKVPLVPNGMGICNCWYLAHCAKDSHTTHAGSAEVTEPSSRSRLCPRLNRLPALSTDFIISPPQRNLVLKC